VLGDKDLEGMFNHLRGIADRLVVTAPESSRSVDPATLADVARERLGPDIEIHVVDGVEAAVRQALRITRPDEALITTGSLYVAGEARPVLRDIGTKERTATWNAHS